MDAGGQMAVNRRVRTGLLLAALLSGCTTIAGVPGDYELYPDACKPGESRACYTGSKGTEGVGPCHGGTQVCKPDGTGFGECEGQVLPAAEDCGTPGLESCRAGSGDHIWSQRVGNGANTFFGYSVAVDRTENIVLSGPFEGTIELGDGPNSFMSSGGTGLYVAKLDSSANPIWSKSLGAGSNEFLVGRHVATDSAENVVVLPDCDAGDVDFGNGPLTGAGHDVCVAKLDTSTGAPLWAKRFGDAGSDYQVGVSVAIDKADNVLLVGDFAGTLKFGGKPMMIGAGSTDVYVAKLDTNATPLWSRSFGDSLKQFSGSIVADSKNNIVVTGGFLGTIDFSGPNCIGLNSQGGSDIFLAKLDPDGNCQWSASVGDQEDDQEGVGLAVDSRDNIVLTGIYRGDKSGFCTGPLVVDTSYELFVAKFDASGALLWRKCFGASPTAASVAIDSADNIVLTGTFANTVDFGGGALKNTNFFSMYVAKLDPCGDHIWSKSYGPGIPAGAGIAVDGMDNIVITGAFQESVDFGGGTLKSEIEKPDIFVAKFSP